jgi:BirA family biotin operon repressor/biotin-[acetyl-CoA-carboxylase] ligase
MSPHPADDPFPGGASLIDSLDRTAVCRAAGLAGIEILAEATSTMDRARELAAGGDVPLPVAVIAERQTAGRGRRGARWWQPPGSLATSLVIDASRVTAPGRPVSPLWSLACGVALAESIIDLEPTVEPLVRWPNDVVTGGRKLAGILVETAPGGRVIFGIGVNTTGSSAEAPARSGWVRARLAWARQVTITRASGSAAADVWEAWDARGAAAAVQAKVAGHTPSTRVATHLRSTRTSIDMATV